MAGQVNTALAGAQTAPMIGGKIDAAWLKKLCLDSGVDDVGFVELGRSAFDDQRDIILDAFPPAKSMISFVLRINRDNVRTPARSIASVEYHYTGDELTQASRKITRALEDMGVRALGTPYGFPYEMDIWPGRVWVVAHKPVAVEAGLGMMGNHRLVLHPKYGAFMYIGTIVIDREISEYGKPITENPCDDCRMCQSSCPTGAVNADGHFDFVSCATHNYRDKLGGFTDWTEHIVDSKNAYEYRRRIPDSENMAMWQSLSYKPVNKCDYCMAVCPAGDDVRPLYENDKKKFMKEIIKPLQKKEEKVYVVPGGDAEKFTAAKYPHKTLRRVFNGLRPTSVENFLVAMPIIFQRGCSEGLDATFHFTFTGSENIKSTVAIKDKTISVGEGHQGEADVKVTADSATWVGFLAKEKNIVWAIITRKIKVNGSMDLFKAFGACFPS